MPRGLRFYQWGDYFGEKIEETYAALLEALKLRYEQKLKIEDELARREKERRERETAEKLEREKAEREAAEKLAREETEREAAEKAASEKAKHEAAEKVELEKVEKAAREKAKYEAVEKSKRERAVRRRAQIARLKSALSNLFHRLRGSLSSKQWLSVLIYIGIVIVILYWFNPWGTSRFASLMLNAKASLTPTLRPSATVTFTSSPEPRATPTKTQIPTPTITLPVQITDTKNVQMVLVTAGEFTMGSNNGRNDEKPVHIVYLDTYYIDKYEVTNALYEDCVEAKVCQPPQDKSSFTHSSYYGNPDFGNYPVINVDWDEAKIYCEWRGTGLPTEAQWEKAARGTDRRTYPWGEGINKTYANYDNYDDGDIAAVGSYENGKSFYGAYDMAGNVWEWVADWYSETYYTTYPIDQWPSNPTGPESGDRRVLRGGVWSLGDLFVRSTYRGGYLYAPTITDTGFRCAMGVY